MVTKWFNAAPILFFIKIAHGRDQLVYYDTWVGQLQRKPHEAASTCLNNAVDKLAMHTYQSNFLNKIVWLIIPLVLKFNNQQQVRDSN